MDPVQDAENQNMPTKAQPTIDLTEEQRDALFGGPCSPGDTYTITLKAGDLGDSGVQTFDVVSKGEDSEGPVNDPEEQSREAANGVLPPDTGDDDEDEAETKALGYNRQKALSGRRKTSPKISAKDLEYD